MSSKELKEFLDEKYEKYNAPAFIESDPISIPHQFNRKEDIEIAGFLSATIAWGQRKSIIRNANRMMRLMDNEPYDFVCAASDAELAKFEGFCHRTFQDVDLVYFVRSLRNIYQMHNGLENVFTVGYEKERSAFSALRYFRQVFFEMDHEKRIEKHVSNVEKGAAAKRLNMFLRWMVRIDGRGVDFGLWRKIPTSVLMLPLDVHTGNVARKLGLLTRKQNDWKALEELMVFLKDFDSNDPVKYDFALFGLGVSEKF